MYEYVTQHFLLAMIFGNKFSEGIVEFSIYLPNYWEILFYMIYKISTSLSQNSFTFHLGLNTIKRFSFVFMSFI